MLLVSDLTRVVEEERGGKAVAAAAVAAQRSSKGHLNLNKHLPRQMGASPGWGTWLHLSTTRPPLSPAPHNSKLHHNKSHYQTVLINYNSQDHSQLNPAAHAFLRTIWFEFQKKSTIATRTIHYSLRKEEVAESNQPMHIRVQAHLPKRRVSNSRDCWAAGELRTTWLFLPYVIGHFTNTNSRFD